MKRLRYTINNLIFEYRIRRNIRSIRLMMERGLK